VRRQEVLFLRVGGGARAGGRARPDGRVGGYFGHLEPALQRVVRRGVRRRLFGRRHHVALVAAGHRGPGLERRLPDDVENPRVAHHDGHTGHHERAHKQDLLWRSSHRVRQYGTRSDRGVQPELAPFAQPRRHQRAETAHPRHRHHHSQIELLVQPANRSNATCKR